MSINPKRITFTFNHTGQPDEYGLSVGDYTVVQANMDSRAQENLDDINQMKDALKSVIVSDEGARNIGTNAVGGAANVEEALEAIISAGSGTIPPDESITLAKQNPTVKTGLLADLVTPDKSNFASAINQNTKGTSDYFTTTGTEPNYVVTTGESYVSIPDGFKITIKPHADSTGTVTLNIDGIGAVNCLTQEDESIVLFQDKPMSLRYNGVNFIQPSSGGLGNFFGDGSDGTIPDLNTITTAPNGGTVSNIWDMNAGTTFLTSSIGASADVVALQIDFQKPVLLDTGGMRIYASQVSTNRTYALQSSDDGISWTQRGTVAITTTPTDRTVSGANSVARYWRLVTTAGTAGTFTCQGLTLNFITGDTQTTKVWRILEPSTINGATVIKQYTDYYLPVGYEHTVQNPCQGLILYSQGDVTINGVIDMSQKAGLAPNGNIIPMLVTKVNLSDVKTIDKYFKLTTALQVLKGGAGGNGGYGGGYSGSTGRQTSVGIGGAGRQNLGGFGGGGSGGTTTDGSTVCTGGVGGSISNAEIGGGFISLSQSGYLIALNGSNGSGGAGGNEGAVHSVGSVGLCNGGGSGGTGASRNPSVTASTQASQYSGGFLMLICKNNITITGIIRSNGGTGSNGGSGAGGNSCGGGGGGGGSGGGVIALFYSGTYTTTGTIQVNGGAGGTGGAGVSTGENGGTGTSGSVGTIHTQQL